MPRITFPLNAALCLALTGCINPGKLHPPGLAIGAFELRSPCQTGKPTSTTLRGAGLIVQPRRFRLGYIQETTFILSPDSPAHLRGERLELFCRPDRIISSPIPEDQHD